MSTHFQKAGSPRLLSYVISYRYFLLSMIIPDCLAPVGMESGSISDNQISASSQQDDNYAPQRGRLNMKISGVKQGGWMPLQNDFNQWLQVNLGSYIRVTRVATQGRDGFDQWVTKYTLRYSVDEASFQFYKKPHEISAKVRPCYQNCIVHLTSKSLLCKCYFSLKICFTARNSNKRWP